MPVKLAQLLNIRPAESNLVGRFLAFSFLVGIAQVLVSTTASTLFLDSFQAQTTQFLPYVYIGSAIVASTIGIIHTRLEKPLSLLHLLTVNLSLLTGALVLFRVVLAAFPQAQGTTMALYIWYYVQDALINLAFWGAAAYIFDVRQSKRLFGLIGTGEMTARIVSGFAISGLVKFIEPENLLWIAAGAVGLCLPLLWSVMRSHQPQTQATGHSRRTAQPTARRPWRILLQNRYLQLMVSLTVLALLGYYFVDILFLTQTQAQFPDKAELAAFMGNFFAIIGLLSFLSRLFIAGPMISRFGLIAGLLALPIAATVGVATIVVAGIATLPMFYPAAFTKLNFIVFRKSTDKSSFPILYQPLPDSERITIQTLMESTVAPIASGLAGVLLLLLPLSTLQTAYLLLVIFGVWIAVIFRINREYKQALLQAITRRTLGGDASALADNAYLSALSESLKSKSVGEVLYALDLMENAAHPDLEKALKRLLSHADPQVRLDVLNRIERLGLTDTLKRVQNRLRLETSAQVLSQAVQTYAALGESDVLEEVLPYLDDTRDQVRHGAMVGLLRSGGVEGVLAAGERFLALSRAAAVESRVAAAAVLGDVGIDNFYRPLLALLQDNHRRVQRAALEAAAKLQNPRLWPHLTPHLTNPQLRGSAAAALTAGGEMVIPLLAEMINAPDNLPETTRQLTRIAGRIKGESSTKLLAEVVIEGSNFDGYAQALSALSIRRYHVDNAGQAAIDALIRQEVEQATLILSGLVDLATTNHGEMLREALNRNLAEHQRRTLLLLSLRFNSEAILQAKYYLLMARQSAANQKYRAYALEVLDLQLPQTLKTLVLPLFNDVSPAEQLAELNTEFPQQSLTPAKRLQTLLDQPHLPVWLTVCAIDCAVRNNIVAPQMLATHLQNNTHPLIQEAVILGLHHLAPNTYQDDIKPLHSAPNQQVSRAAQRYLNPTASSQGGITMLSTFEKVLILKAVDIFTETPDNILADISTILDEIEVEAETDIFKKGDLGDAMYIIVSGKIRIHDDGRTLATLSERQMFGELTVLDAEPRSATATSTTPSSLFRLAQEPFYELMADQPEISQGIIKMLSRRLRAVNQQVTPTDEKNKPRRRADDMRGLWEKLE